MSSESGSALPPLALGAKMAGLGDSIISLGKTFTTAGARTTADNRSVGEMIVARALKPRFRHFDWWDGTATNANRAFIYNDIPAGPSGNADTYRSGATLAYPGDTVNGITKRRAQVLGALGASPGVVFIAAGTNTDAPNTAAFKLSKLDPEIAAFRAAGHRVVLATVRPRSSGDRETLTNVLSTTSGSAVVRLVRAGHGLTNTSAQTKEMEFVAPGVTIGGLTLNGIVRSGTGGYTVNVVDANTLDITCPTTASGTVAGGGGSFTWHRNFFTSAGGLTAVGLCVMPSSAVWAEHDILNTAIRAKHDPANGIYVADFTPAYRDVALSAITGVTLEIDKSLTNDGVHPNHKGGWLGGQALNTVLDQVIADGYWFTRNVASGNLLANPTMTGTTGTANNGASGTLPANCFLSNVAGAGRAVTAVCSVEANAETGGQTVVITITSDGTGAANTLDVLRMSFTNPATGFVSTDTVVFAADVISAASPILGNVQLTLGQGSTLSAYGFRNVGAVANRDPGACRFYDHDVTLETEPLLVGARTGLNPRIDITVRNDLAGTATVRIPWRKLFIAPDPSAAFPWVP